MTVLLEKSKCFLDLSKSLKLIVLKSVLIKFVLIKKKKSV